jgi:8-oxo-dGTP diphosphatase
MKSFHVGLAGLIEKSERFLVLQRSADKDFAPNIWEPVTGRLEENENPKDGILREIKEETGIKAQVVMPVDTWFFYRGDKEFPMVFIAFWCKHVEGEVKLSWEHAEYKWITFDEAFSEPALEHFHQSFGRIEKLKQHLPENLAF